MADGDPMGRFSLSHLFSCNADSPAVFRPADRLSMPSFINAKQEANSCRE
jgi:hypothetical protein